MLRAFDPGEMPTMVTSAAPRRWIAVAALLALAPAAPAVADDYDDLVAAERAFAADASARNVREAFLTAIHDEGIIFAPGPVRSKDVFSASPDDGTKLEWAPEGAEIAASGELGYTYGPWRLTPKGEEKPTRFGHFFTVWQKQADGTWRALVDKGVRHAEQPLPTEVVRRGALRVQPAGDGAVTPAMLVELRQADLLPVGEVTPIVIAPDFLRLRPGEAPRAVTESPALQTGPATKFQSWAVIAKSGDLAATWGGSVGGGSWVRVWRRSGVGDPPGQPWRLVFDVADVVLPPAPEQ
jgi:hypothetical protein